jgi:two-component system response regulator AtoC
MIRGESGTGKDLIAKAIHNLSPRGTAQLIEINCAALPESLLESELFGYEKGAFTDAKQRKTGLAEIANGGTLFLDEVGELPLSLQAKLLKFIETKSFRRIGGTAEIWVDLMIIASTNRNLEEAIESGSFRQDLYYRLNVLPIYVPPLRERGEDVIKVAEYYLQYFCRKFNKPPMTLDATAKKAFLSYQWPGNVRELKNLIERVVILSSGHKIGSKLLPGEMKGSIAESQTIRKSYKTDNRSLDEILAEIEKELIHNALRKAKGVKSEAAKILGISRYALLRKMKRLPFDDQC